MAVWVFDLDGTLVDSFGFYIRIVQDLFKEHELILTDALVAACLGTPATKFLATHIPANGLGQAMQTLTERSRADAKDIQVFEGLLQLLRQLREQGDRIALWTSRDLESATLVLEATGLSQFIEYAVSGTCVAGHKPNPEGLLKICEFFSCTPNDVVVIGDHDVDVVGAKNAGARAVRASWHGYNPPAACLVADHHFYEVTAFLNWVIAEV